MFRSGQHAPTSFSPFYGLYQQQVAVLILHPNRVKTGMGEYNVPRPVEKDANHNESFDLENSGSFLNLKDQQLPWCSTILERKSSSLATSQSGQVIMKKSLYPKGISFV